MSAETFLATTLSQLASNAPARIGFNNVQSVKLTVTKMHKSRDAIFLKTLPFEV